MDCCPHCNKPLIVEADRPMFNFAKKSLTYRGVTVVLQPQQMAIVEILLDAGERGMRIHAIAAEIYRDRSDDETPQPHTLQVIFSQIRRRFYEAGMPISIACNHAGRAFLTMGAVPKRQPVPQGFGKMAGAM